MAYSKTKEIEKEWTIPAQGEFRFEISFDQKISIQVHNIIYDSSYLIVDKWESGNFWNRIGT